MASDASISDGAQDPEVVASVDPSAVTPEFIIADISRDGAWVSINAPDAPVLDDWR